MDLYWYGQACFKIKGKQTSIIIDPFSPEFTGLKLPKDMSADIAIKTHEHEDHSNLSAVTGDPVLVTGPGEYEIKGVAVTGVQTPHDAKGGEERGNNTVYTILIEGLNIVHLGDLGDKLTQEQVEGIGLCDILLIPVGGVYTIGPEQATQIISQLEPSIIIPMHYKLPGLKFDLSELDVFVKEMGVENVEPQTKLTITKDKLPAEPQVVVLSKT